MRKTLLAVGVGAAVVPFLLYPVFRVFELDSTGSLVLLIDIAIVGLIAAGIALGFRSPRGRTSVLVKCIACGSLVGAGFVGPLQVAPYAFGAALLFGVVAFRDGAWQRGGRAVSTGSIVAATLFNFACLWPFTLGRYRPIAETDFLSLDLRIHSLMADTPLHDVWSVRVLSLGREATLQDLDQALNSYGIISGNDRVAVAVVFSAYLVVSRVFGWHNDECARSEDSVKRRLTEADRERSTSSADRGPFLYQFEKEAAIEIQTCAGHAVYAYAIGPAEHDHTLYWAAYSLPVGWFTPFYLAVVDPVRKLIVFPSLLERFERAWRERWAGEHRRFDAQVDPVEALMHE